MKQYTKKLTICLDERTMNELETIKDKWNNREIEVGVTHTYSEIIRKIITDEYMHVTGRWC